MGLPFQALIGRMMRPGVRNAALFCKHLVSSAECKRHITLRPLYPSPSTLSALQAGDQGSVLDHGRNDVEVLDEMRLELE